MSARGRAWPLEGLRRAGRRATLGAGRTFAQARGALVRAEEEADAARRRADEARGEASRTAWPVGPAHGAGLLREASVRRARDAIARHEAGAETRAREEEAAARRGIEDAAAVLARTFDRAAVLDRAAGRWKAERRLREVAREERESEEAWPGCARARPGR